jgi:hypothetical protein
MIDLQRYFYAESGGDVLVAFTGETERDHWCRKLGFVPLSRHAVRHRYMPKEIRKSWQSWPIVEHEGGTDGHHNLTAQYMSQLKKLNFQHSKLKRERIMLQRMLKSRGHVVSLRTM